MKTPEETKKVLECCYGNKERRLCEKCPNACKVEGYSELICTDFDSSGENALAYIRELEARIDTLTAKAVLFDDAIAAGEKMKRERDAAVADLAENRRCETCKYYTPGYFCIGCRRGDQWEWRGIQEDKK